MIKLMAELISQSADLEPAISHQKAVPPIKLSEDHPRLVLRKLSTLGPS